MARSLAKMKSADRLPEFSRFRRFAPWAVPILDTTGSLSPLSIPTRFLLPAGRRNDNAVADATKPVCAPASRSPASRLPCQRPQQTALGSANRT
jgi:hypothetical protein